ncbi:MAG: hypothetical protein MK208_06240 [Shimia sp.]|uniref:hypothetical protein n=1 Tax=Shimia sp. TaxID=1954381 RepID=UPI0025F99E51|nr:hypothetical protein [Shimia sp.]MCH2066810.1 hypothetical protein [Shimia sp.]
MKSNAPIFYILSQIGVFCIVYTLLLASHRTSFAIDFCALEYANKTAMNLVKVAIFVALIHAPGVIIAHRFAEITWKVAALPFICALGFIFAHYANDILLGLSGNFHCETDLDKSDMRSIFRTNWTHVILSWTALGVAYGWGLSSLFVLYKTSKVPSELYED